MKVAQSSGTRVYPERVGYDYKVSHEWVMVAQSSGTRV
jgi:hypothetical protein